MSNCATNHLTSFNCIHTFTIMIVWVKAHPRRKHTDDPTAGCRYYLPGPLLPSQPHGINDLHTAYWQRHSVCTQLNWRQCIKLIRHNENFNEKYLVIDTSQNLTSFQHVNNSHRTESKPESNYFTTSSANAEKLCVQQQCATWGEVCSMSYKVINKDHIRYLLMINTQCDAIWHHITAELNII